MTTLRQKEDSILAEQVAYYRARASEYDEWWTRSGRYEQGPEAAAHWQSEVAIVEKSLADFAPVGDVLELACGTGWWTEKLAASAVTLTCIDTAPEMLALNRTRLETSGRRLPRYIQTDLFEWVPDRAYDIVFFSFWISHVPSAKFAKFWSMVRSALKPGGRVFLIDEPSGDPYPKLETELQHRRVNDGQPFTIVKIYYEPAELEQKLHAIGWQADIRRTPTFFFYGMATPR